MSEIKPVLEPAAQAFADATSKPRQGAINASHQGDWPTVTASTPNLCVPKISSITGGRGARS
jgi:hypothetical protein